MLLGPPGRVPARALVFERLVLDGRVEAEERLEVLGLAEELERVEVEERLDWDDRLVEPDRAWLDRLTLLFLLGLRLPER